MQIRNFIFEWPVLFFVVFFALQLFVLEPVSGVFQAPLGKYSQLIPFILRIVLVLGVWIYLFPESPEAFQLSPAKLPLLLTVAMLLYGLVFLPMPLPSMQFDGMKFSLHFLISSWEEILMRGLFLWLLLRAYPSHPLVILIAVGCVFGLLHLLNLLHGAPIAEVLPQVIWSCVLGLGFTVITYKTGSILPAILIHSMFNAIPALLDGKPWVLQKAGEFGVAPAIFVALVFVPLLILSLKSIAD